MSRTTSSNRNSKTDFNHLKKWMQPLLEERGLSVENLADLVGVSRAAIYQYWKDTHRPSEDVTLRICQSLGRPFEEGLKQYTPRKSGRPEGYSPSGPRELR